ncbi:hypothetical protein M0G43_14285 [Subsaxibacter sp. CAU 1640]|uniref:DUF6503 family protein n=1 Tax=Subsaxibacter sp. CAU 1640 TaxID=2933271 RepID=UPI002005B532|nr:DUF6503 family protein [Subsaxibacter sp. CAU 1640]MCK7591754.1 hypothetical protein [Subsaxibacter sp. CAU 1640]
MKKLFYLVCTLTLIVSCKDKTSTNTTNDKETVKDSAVEVEKPKYPENLVKVFDAHGGLDTWKTMRTLEFSMQKPDGYEITTTDLKERYSLVEMPKHTIGFDGESVWMKSTKGAKYEGNPAFYYNLMFYFYAMPFVLADAGINYSEAEALTVEGKTYPGIKIAYNAGVGASSDDEYVLYYDKDTYHMTWLAYTVTFGKNEKSNDWNFIKYAEWQEVDNLLLPKSITWYNVDNNQPTTVKNEVEFSNISLSTDKMDLRMYMMPEGAEEIL